MANAIGTDALAFIILVFVFANTNKRAERSFTQHKLFSAILLTSAAMIFFDAVGWAINGLPTRIAYYTNWASMLLLYTLAPGIPALYVLYACHQVFRGEKRVKPLAFPLIVPVVLDAVFNLSSIFTGWTFSVDAANHYHRGPLLFLHMAYCYSMLLGTVIFILVNKKRVDERHFSSLLAFGLLPAGAGALSVLMPALSIVQPSMALSVLLLYMNIQDRRLDTDFLTGVYNRRLLDRYMKEKSQPGGARKAFSAILIDLDNFKEINDKLGHATGDAALTDAVRLLQACLRRGDFVSRYGGDEFLIILDIDRKEVLEETVERIRECFRLFNENGKKPYQLRFSTGYDVYDSASGIDPEQFIQRVDEKMYEEKKAAGRPLGTGRDAWTL